MIGIVDPSVGYWLPVKVRCVADVSDVYTTKIFVLSSHYNHFDNEDDVKTSATDPNYAEFQHPRTWWTLTVSHLEILK
jgi:hypothetical protein